MRIWLHSRIEFINDQRKTDGQNVYIAAWFTAAWTRTKRMPSHRSLMKTLGIESQESGQTPAQMLKTVEMLNLAMGGADLRKDKN